MINAWRVAISPWRLRILDCYENKSLGQLDEKEDKSTITNRDDQIRRYEEEQDQAEGKKIPTRIGMCFPSTTGDLFFYMDAFKRNSR